MTHPLADETRTVRIAPIIVVLLVSGALVDIQAVSLNPLVGTIAAESRLSAADIGWVLNGSLLAGAVSVGLTSRLGDRYGHRKILIILTLVAMAGCALSATGTTFWPLVVGRFLSGLALGIPLGWGLLRPRAKARTIRRVSLSLALALAVLTPVTVVASGALVTNGLPWQSVFWLTFILFSLLLVFAVLSPESPREARENVQVDWFGAMGIGVWVTALLIAISEGPGRGWTSPLVLGAIVVFAVALTVWTIQQRRTATPLVSFQGMDVRQLLVGFSGILTVGVAGPVIFIGLPLLLQAPSSSEFGLGVSPLVSAYTLLAMIPGCGVGYLWTRWGLEHLGPRMVLVMSGCAAILVYIGYALAHQTLWLAFLFVFGYAATVLSCLTVGYTLVVSSGRPDNMAVTVGMQSIIQYVSSIVPVPILLNVLAPGTDGSVQESAFVGVLIAVCVLLAVLVLAWAVLAPRHVVDKHAIDAAPELETV